VRENEWKRMEEKKERKIARKKVKIRVRKRLR
jgi:hypothetical protein